ncbi:MAG TPA: hypothetical protein VFE65_28180 [Pseudonocardia sp.]|jgi:hypothetical protein|nr:hypothetical protein [Pseudonocardia sp.]
MTGPVALGVRVCVAARRRLVHVWDDYHRAWGAQWSQHQPWRGDDLPPDQGQLRWRSDAGEWQLHGRFAPGGPATGGPAPVKPAPGAHRRNSSR